MTDDGGKHLDRLSRDNFSLGAIKAGHVASEGFILIIAIIIGLILESIRW